MDVTVVRRKRLLSKEEGDELVGTPVGDREPDLTEAAIVVDADTDEPILGYFPMDREVASRLRRAVREIKYGETYRGSTGLRNRSRTFGMAPRNPLIRRNSCRPTSLAHEQPEPHAVVAETSRYLGEQLQQMFPEVFDRDRETLRALVDDEWRMAEDSMWTSGVINRTSTLPYHRDGFNFDTWSAMPVLRRKVDGGHLHFPEYDLTVGCRDAWSVYFCGYRWVHGVTPMSVDDDGYRYSVVYYALRGMKDCFTYAVETATAQAKRTETESGHARKLRGEESWGEFA